MIKLYNFDELRPEEILNRDIRAEKNVEDVVDGIIAEVRARGDEALKEYALKFDGAKIDDLQVTQAEIDAKMKITRLKNETAANEERCCRPGSRHHWYWRRHRNGCHHLPDADRRPDPGDAGPTDPASHRCLGPDDHGNLHAGRRPDPGGRRDDLRHCYCCWRSDGSSDADAECHPESGYACPACG